jgi:N-acetylglucosaminyldiphosphoundecaprenol N-acetyl-beta-D-mannosaminyltransferase
MNTPDSYGKEITPEVARPVDDSLATLAEYRICGVKLHAVQVDNLLAVVHKWMGEKRAFHYVSSTNVNNVNIALESENYFDVMEEADLSIPDGVPFLWVGRMKGFALRKRCGIEEFMEAVFELSNKGYNYTHYFYGNTPKVLANMKARLLQRYPNLKIAGMYSPPFRALSPQEDEEDIRMINDAGADFLWVSLGCPKQEKWLYDHRNRLNVVIGGGSGAVFNFFSGDTFKAPDWVRYMGLEWILRLIIEPKRLFRRYCIKYPIFVFRFIKYSLGIGKHKRLHGTTTTAVAILFFTHTVADLASQVVDFL